jgi:hypothetical protein
MKHLILALSFVVVTACAAAPQKQAVHFTEQDDLNCKSYGITGGMLAQRRDRGMSEDAAVADVQREFSKLNNSDPRNKIALDYVDGQFRTIADAVYASYGYQPKTILLFFPTLCLAKQAGLADRQGTTFIFNQAMTCQRQIPLTGVSQDFRVHDGPTMNLQTCVQQSTAPLFK